MTRRYARRFRGSGGVAAVPNPMYAPPTVSGASLKLWLEPSDTTTGINTIVSGGFTVLGDKTATHAAWTQPGASTARPTTSTIGGKQCVRSTRSPLTWMNGPTLATNFAAGCHMFWVVQTDFDPPAAQTPHHKVDSNTVGFNFYPNNADSNVYDGWGSTTRKSTGNPPLPLTTAHVYEVISIAGEHTFRRNDTTDFTTAVNVVGWDAAQAMLFAGSTGVGVSPPTNGIDARFGTLLQYNAKLSASDATAVINSLKAWWGIA